MEKENVILQTTLPSVIHPPEISGELVKLSEKKGYPVKKAKKQRAMDNKFVGFGLDYMITAKMRPPVPGGWTVEIVKFEPGHHEMLVPVKSQINEQGNQVGEINSLVLRMLDEFRKEGLEIHVSDEYEKVYGTVARRIKAKGHPILLDNLDEFVENMR